MAGLPGIHPNLGTGGRGGVGLENLDLFKCAAHCDKGVVGLSRFFLLGASRCRYFCWKTPILLRFVFQAPSAQDSLNICRSGNKGFQVRLFGQCLPMLTLLCPSLPPPLPPQTPGNWHLVVATSLAFLEGGSLPHCIALVDD